MREECIKVQGLTKSFQDRTVVDHLSFSVGKGEVFGLVGHNGAGKSTTIDMILGLKKPDAGLATIWEMDALKNRKKIFEKVGVQFQSSSYQAAIRVEEVCREYAAFYRKPADYRELLEQFDLAPLAFVGAWFLTLIYMFSIGLMIASLCHTVKQMNAVTSLVYFPMLFLSGATIPYELFPKGLQKVANIMPLTQGIKLMKAVSMGKHLPSSGYIILLLLAITVICSIISLKTFRWE